MVNPIGLDEMCCPIFVTEYEACDCNERKTQATILHRILADPSIYCCFPTTVELPYNEVKPKSSRGR